MISLFESIADGLAGHSYAIADQFLSQAQVRSITKLEAFQKGLQNFKKAGIGKQGQHQINEGIRGDFIQWLDKTSAAPELSTYINRVERLMQFLNQALFLSL